MTSGLDRGHLFIAKKTRDVAELRFEPDDAVVDLQRARAEDQLLLPGRQLEIDDRRRAAELHADERDDEKIGARGAGQAEEDHAEDEDPRR